MTMTMMEKTENALLLMSSKRYRFKNKALENALGVLYGEEYIADQVNRQMPNTTSYIEFESDEGSTTIAKEEIEQLREDSNQYHEPEVVST